MRASIQSVKTKCLSDVGRIAEALVYHASSKQNCTYVGSSDTASYLLALRQDTQAHYCHTSTYFEKEASYLSDILPGKLLWLIEREHWLYFTAF